MDSIDRIAKGRRMEAESENLREKVSREIENIIKVQVAQDTDYWELKEMVQQVEATRERLEQNMIEVQMQYEAVSARYQDELQRRPETLNKVAATRELCDVLEENIERLRATLARCRADQAALAEIYERTCREIQQMKESVNVVYNQIRLKNMAQINKLEKCEERVGIAMNAAREVKARGGVLERRAQEIVQQVVHAAASLTAVNVEREKLTTALFHEYPNNAENSQKIKQDQATFEARIDEMQHTIQRLEKGYSEAQRLAQEKLNMRQANETHADDLEATLKDLKLDYDTSMERIQAAEITLHEKKTIMINNINIEIDNLVYQISVLETDNIEKQAETKRKLEEGEKQIKELTVSCQQEAAKAVEAKNAIDDLRASIEKQVFELKATIEQKNAELDAKADATTRAMDDIKKADDSKARLKEALRTAQESAQLSIEAEHKLRECIKALEVANQEKDITVAEMTEAVRQITAERERLQEQEKGLRSTIEGVQVQLKNAEIHKQPERETDVVTTGTADNYDMIKRANTSRYDFLSDDSDVLSLDPNEVQRRFEALRLGDRNLAPLRTRRKMAMAQSQAQVELQMKSQKRFFKNKRPYLKKRGIAPEN